MATEPTSFQSPAEHYPLAYRDEGQQSTTAGEKCHGFQERKPVGWVAPGAQQETASGLCGTQGDSRASRPASGVQKLALVPSQQKEL